MLWMEQLIVIWIDILFWLIKNYYHSFALEFPFTHKYMICFAMCITLKFNDLLNDFEYCNLFFESFF